MKIIVCGAGSVGKSIVGYLSHGNNDIIVIDNNQTNLDELSKEYEVQSILGMASHPEVLEKAGAKDADLILAVTNSDEVNMVICQVAYSVFNIQTKIARIDAQDYLDPVWTTLYNDGHLPIDLIISPDIEISKAIYRILKIPGALDAIDIANNEITLLAFRCGNGCPLVQTSIVDLERIAPELDVSIVSIIRDGKSFVPNNDDIIEKGDDVYFLVRHEEIEDAIHAFGMERPANEKIIIFGGNQISKDLANKIEKDDNILSCKIIEENVEQAQALASSLDNVVVIHGAMMSDVILSEAGIENADVSVAVTTKDKDNLLASLIAKANNVNYTIALVNSRSYDKLIDNIGDNILVDRSSVTISVILKELRKVKIREAYSLGRGFGEIWELKIDDNNINLDKIIKDLNLPKNSKICAIVRGKDIIYPKDKEKIIKDDLLVLFVSSNEIKKVEKIFS